MQYQANQEESKREIDGMKDEAVSAGKVMLIEKSGW